MNSPFRSVLLVLASLLILSNLTACGQRGDLYLPDRSEHPQKASLSPSTLTCWSTSLLLERPRPDDAPSPIGIIELVDAYPPAAGRGMNKLAITGEDPHMSPFVAGIEEH